MRATMRRRCRKLTRPGMLVAAAVLLATAPALAGPPWISIEYPANGIDRATRGALALVHIYHHETPVGYPVEGMAVGMVDGKRVTLPLSIEPTSRVGVSAIRGEIPQEGTWVLVITAKDGSDRSLASVLVALGPGNDEVSLVKVPRMREGNWPRPATDQDVDAMLEMAVAVAEAEKSVAARFQVVKIVRAVLVGTLVLLPVGLVTWRRREA